VHVLQKASQAEVGDSDLASAVEQDVGGLQVAVQHPLVVHRRQPQAELAGDLDPLLLRQPPDLLEQPGQVLAIDVLHREERLAVVLGDVEHVADMGVRDLPGDAHFLVEAGQAVGVVGQAFGQELEGHGLPQLQVVGTVDFSHTALAQQGHDAIASGEQLAREEAWLVGRWEGRR
jgi:hypothetical protein